MSSSQQTLEQGKFYHIYNRGVNSCDLFNDEKNYIQFLSLYDKFISPIADTFAWVLMENHFHLLVQIKENVIYKYSKNGYTVKSNEFCLERQSTLSGLSNADRFIDSNKFDEIKWQTIDLSTCKAPDSVNKKTKIPNPQLHFSHLFNAYSKYFNKCYERHGNLFETPFKRKQIDNDDYLKQAILYINNNPVHHEFCKSPEEYLWSSYKTCITTKPTKLKREYVIGLFENLENFILVHKNKSMNFIEFDEWLGL